MPVFSDLNTDYNQNVQGVLLSDVQAVQNKLFNLLRCRRGSRFRQPRFGTRLPELVHEPCDNQTASTILTDFIDQIKEWVPELTLIMEQTYVIPRPSKDGFLVNIAFDVPRLRQSGALTFSALRE